MKTLVYTTAIDSSNRVAKGISDTNIFDITRQSWEHYCERHGADFYVIDEPQLENTSPHWFRYWIFDLKPGYDRYMYIDTDIMAKWDAPNIFDECADTKHIYAVRDNSGLSWIWEGLKSYESMFPDTNVEWDTYFNSGMLVFSKEHEQLIQDFKQFYIDNSDIIEEYRLRIRKGFDQTIFNYFTTWYGQSVRLISEKWNLFHMIRREILGNGYFIDMGYFWHFNGVPRDHQLNVLQNIWQQIKSNYR